MIGGARGATTSTLPAGLCATPGRAECPSHDVGSVLVFWRGARRDLSRHGIAVAPSLGLFRFPCDGHNGPSSEAHYLHGALRASCTNGRSCFGCCHSSFFGCCCSSQHHLKSVASNMFASVVYQISPSPSSPPPLHGPALWCSGVESWRCSVRGGNREIMCSMFLFP